MARQLGSKFPCRDCGVEVVWAESKSGSKYLAGFSHWNGDFTTTQLTFLPSHKCTPNPELIAKREAAKAERDSLIASGVKAPEGRILVTGTVAKIVNRDADFGGLDWKMTVRSDEGWSVWCSVPKAWIEGRRPSLLVGDRVSFKVTMTTGGNNLLLGFGKLPKPVEILEKVGA